MRHQKKTPKLGRKSQHTKLMLANLVASLILHHRIKTTLAKAKAAKPLAEKLVTLGKGGTQHHRRLAISKIGQPTVVTKLFREIAPKFQDRKGGYTRIIKLGPRNSDSAPVAFLEWVDYAVETAPVVVEEKATKKTSPQAGDGEAATEPKDKK